MGDGIFDIMFVKNTDYLVIYPKKQYMLKPYHSTISTGTYAYIIKGHCCFVVNQFLFPYMNLSANSFDIALRKILDSSLSLNVNTKMHVHPSDE